MHAAEAIVWNTFSVNMSEINNKNKTAASISTKIYIFPQFKFIGLSALFG